MDYLEVFKFLNIKEFFNVNFLFLYVDDKLLLLLYVWENILTSFFKDFFL